MKKYKSLLESNDTVALEFYLHNKRIFLLCNGMETDFKTFWTHYPEAKRVMYQIYKHIAKEFYDIATPSANWVETLIKFINDHLNKFDNRLDVFIRNNGKVDINLER